MVSFPFVRCTTGWFVELYFRPEHPPGVENIPKTGPCIIASNHASNLDPYMLGYTIKERELYFIAKEELFHNPIFGWIIRMNNAFPVKRGQKDLEAIRKFHDFIQTGKPLAIFMEGTRTHDGNLQPPKKGVTAADIVEFTNSVALLLVMVQAALLICTLYVPSLLATVLAMV